MPSAAHRPISSLHPTNADKNPHAHFANPEDAAQIANWVKSGGVLMIMENDTSFADLDHFNVVSEKFGIHFNSVLRKHVIGANWSREESTSMAEAPSPPSAHGSL